MSAINNLNVSTQEPVEQFGPIKTKFISTDGKIKEFFFRNNPWKSHGYQSQKNYRYCIVCGTERLGAYAWANNYFGFAPPTICSKSDCWDELEFLASFVPRHHYINQDYGVKLYEEHFEDVPNVTSQIRNDKVYADDSQIPQEYIDILKGLERYPVKSRISKIDDIYFEYAEENNISFGQYMWMTSDPFLKTLANYRERCVWIMK